MNICKSLLKRLGLIAGALVLLPLLAVVIVGLTAIVVPVGIIAVIIAAFTMSNESLNECLAIGSGNDMIID